MKRVLVVLVSTGIVAGVTWYLSRQPRQADPVSVRSGNGGIGERVGEGDRPEEPGETILAQSRYYEEPKTAPEGWESFREESQSRRLARVTEAMHDREPIDAELYAFFKAELFNRDHWDVTRNNMANALVWARDRDRQHPDPGLHEVFIQMLEDETENTVWRDYCLQFLSENLGSSRDPERVKGVIARFSTGDDSIAGTAMVHMALQEEYGAMELDDGFSARLATQLENPEVHRDTKLAILGVMGKRGDVEQLPLIRTYARQDENAGLKRVAIAAIGTIGASEETRDSITDEDRALVKAALTHRNRAVQMAATAAAKRLATASE